MVINLEYGGTNLFLLKKVDTLDTISIDYTTLHHEERRVAA